MEFKCAGIVQESIVDGLGIRMVVFCQGCTRQCEGCHNKHTWDPKGGYWESTNNIIEMYKKNPLLNGITLSGGEPFRQPDAMLLLAEEIHRLGGNVWLYTGYTLDKLLDMILESFGYVSYKLLGEIDVLVDGPFILDKRDLTLDWRGSSNQRVIELAKFRNDVNAFDKFRKDLNVEQKELLESCLNIQRS